MAANGLAPALAFTEHEEGGYQCVQGDPGNWTGGEVDEGELIGTNFGISAAELVTWNKANGLAAPTIADMQGLSRQIAQAILTANYWNKTGCVGLPAGIDLMVFDEAVNAGPSESAILLQGVVGVTEDGEIGPATRAAVEQYREPSLLAALAAAQLSNYMQDADFPTFGVNWLGRLGRRLSAAVALL